MKHPLVYTLPPADNVVDHEDATTQRLYREFERERAKLFFPDPRQKRQTSPSKHGVAHNETRQRNIESRWRW